MKFGMPTMMVFTKALQPPGKNGARKMNRQYRRRFHDDQFYAVAFGQAVEETEEIRKRKRK
jgi:hypothetical protein